MLEPREADLLVLFLVFVVLPLVTYILLGKWSEVSERKERIGLLAQLAAEEAFRAESMTTTLHIPVRTSSKTNILQCARCSSPATTRCSGCKSARYCSGKCQIIHWRQAHKLECQRLDALTSNFSLKPATFEESINQRVLQPESFNSLFPQNNTKEAMRGNASSNKPNCISSLGTPRISAIDSSRVSSSERTLFEPNSEVLQGEGVCFSGLEEASVSQLTSPCSSSVSQSTEASSRHKLGNDIFMASPEETCKADCFRHVSDDGSSVPRSTMHETRKVKGKGGKFCMPGSNCSTSKLPCSDQVGRNAFASGSEFLLSNGNAHVDKFTSNNESEDFDRSAGRISLKSITKSKSKGHASEPRDTLSPLSTSKASKEKDRKGHVPQIPQLNASMPRPAQGSNTVHDSGVMNKTGLKKSPDLPRPEASGASAIAQKKMKVLFSYEEFMKYFQCEAWDISPRGLLNCGNSCYANAVLQCLACTKPLNIYLLGRSHSRNCHVKDWCLMCELEQLVAISRECEGPLSPSRILSHMRNISFQMGGGSQEDAHEFLRLLVASMQSICLAEVGGERKVDPRLQETTFIQHAFGGCLRSKVRCLKCHHESERYERIMDLTLEILGWVESLEDALTQFTACEDLDGENMYRCGRCTAYVRARKQLSIHEAPNILTIVLKRFQKGSYGKINKCITFPEMLDMIPFMTGTGDSPPLYMLYAVVVHLDTLNASFSGHYVSYVKDQQGTWFRIDDSEVQPVPMSQVMSEGAYVLFYSRSFPRTPTTGKSTALQSFASARHCFSKTLKSAKHGQHRPSESIFTSEHLPHSIPHPAMGGTSNLIPTNGTSGTKQSVLPSRETYGDSISMDFSDATSSDWSTLFTSSDESSFTTESTRDSFSTVDYMDSFTADPISSIFNGYTPEYSANGNISCRSFSHCKPQTKTLSEGKSFVLNSYLSGQPLSKMQNGKNPSRLSISSA